MTKTEEDIEWLCIMADIGCNDNSTEISYMRDREKIDKIKSDLISRKRVKEAIEKVYRNNDLKCGWQLDILKKELGLR